jgi:hypothetical protein
MNSNPEYLYGDVLGWFIIASVSIMLLFLARGERLELREDTDFTVGWTA